MLSKKKAEQRHAAKRFLERGLTDFSKRLNETFCKLIQTRNNAELVRKQSNRVTVWDISYEEKIYRCVYDKDRKQIVTLLSVTPKGVTKSSSEAPPPPKKEGIFKYGVLWKSAEALQKHEDYMKKRYENDYEKWALQFKTTEPFEDLLI